MATYLISYDLIGPNRNYAALDKHMIDTYGTRAKPLESVWIVVTDKSAAAIRDGITAHTDSNDKVLVARLEGSAAWTNIDQQTSDWMKRNL